MKVIKFLVLTFFSVFMISCASTAADDSEKIVVTNKPLTEAEEVFIANTENLKLSLVQKPRDADFGKPFATSYIVQVKDSNAKAVPDLSVTVKYPVSKQNKKVAFETKELTTDKNGKVYFKADKTDFAVTSKITFSPTPVSNNKKVVETCKNVELSADFRIKSQLVSKGTLLFIWEFNEKDKPANNCYTILSELQAKGALVGNAPINDEKYITAATSTIYKLNYDIVENNFGYLIGGTVKFVNPVEKTDGGYKCDLIADIYVIDMANGQKIYSCTQKTSAEDVKYDKAISNCKKALSKLIVEDIVDNI